MEKNITQENSNVDALENNKLNAFRNITNLRAVSASV